MGNNQIRFIRRKGKIIPIRRKSPLERTMAGVGDEDGWTKKHKAAFKKKIRKMKSFKSMDELDYVDQMMNYEKRHKFKGIDF